MAIGDLFNNVNIFGAGLPPGSGGLLTEDEQKKLANQSLVQGILGTAASYLAQPKTGRYGSALPYLGKAFLGGMQASQGAYNTALNRAFQAKALQERGKQLYNVDGALVDRTGNVVYQSPKESEMDVSSLLAMPEVQQDKYGFNLLKTSPKSGVDYFTKKFQSKEDLSMKPPAGYVWKVNPDGSQYINPETLTPEAIPIPGTEVAFKREEAKTKKETGEAGKATIAGTVIVDAQRALDTIENNPNYTTGAPGAGLQYIPGTDAYALSQMVDSVKANVGIDKLLDIKASGAGLGQVPQSQLDMLASVLGGLNVGQPTDVLKYNLKRVKKIYSDIVKSAGGQEALDKALAEAEATPEAKTLEQGNIPTGVKVRKTK